MPSKESVEKLFKAGVFTETPESMIATKPWLAYEPNVRALAEDTQPSRKERAKQELQDLERRTPGVRIGLVAFATRAHVVTPLTEDGKSLLHALPALSPELVRLPGSRVGDALERALRQASRDLLTLEQSGVSYGLKLPALTIAQAKGPAQLQRCLQALALC